MRIIQLQLSEQSVSLLGRELKVLLAHYTLQGNLEKETQIADLVAEVRAEQKMYRPKELEQVFPVNLGNGQGAWLSQEEIDAARAQQGQVGEGMGSGERSDGSVGLDPSDRSALPGGA